MDSVFGALPWIGTIHNPVRVHLYPCNTMRPLCFTTHPILVNVTSHPALHSLTTDSNEWEERPGMMCASFAASGRFGMLRVQVCEEDTFPPSGRVTTRGLEVGCRFVVGAAKTRK